MPVGHPGYRSYRRMSYRRLYGFMVRFAFQRLVEGLLNLGPLERHLSKDTELPLRYA